MNLLKPNQQRGRIALVFIWMVLATEVLIAGATFLEYRLLEDAQQDIFVAPETVAANDTLQQWVTILAVLVYLVSFWTFILWFRRAYFNLHQLCDSLEHREGWAAGAWFVPFINLYRPLTIMRELYEKTREYLENRRVEVPDFSTGLLGFWWAIWILNWILSRTASNMSLRAQTLAEHLNSDLLMLISCVTAVVLSVLTAKVIRDYMSLEKLFWATASREDFPEVAVDQPVQVNEFATEDLAPEPEKS